MAGTKTFNPPSLDPIECYVLIECADEPHKKKVHKSRMAYWKKVLKHNIIMLISSKVLQIDFKHTKPERNNGSASLSLARCRRVAMPPSQGCKDIAHSSIKMDRNPNRFLGESCKRYYFRWVSLKQTTQKLINRNDNHIFYVHLFCVSS